MIQQNLVIFSDIEFVNKLVATDDVCDGTYRLIKLERVNQLILIRLQRLVDMDMKMKQKVQ